jgi:hypothetical protein
MTVSRIKPLLFAVGVIIAVLVAVSLLDILLVFFNPRFYSNALFITTFGVGGVFATVLAYMMSVERSLIKDEFARWSLIILLIVAGAAFWFILSRLEGGEYEAAFKAFGLTMALSTILFMKGKVE